jgi:branched-chain amino acid transport system substrate-binding protein
VYLAAFDEVVGLFDAASGDPVLGSVPWYGSDGVALTPRLVADAKAAAFAAAVGYPNPTLGLSDAVTRKAKKLVDRIRSKLGHEPDVFALTAYDALQVAVGASARAGTAPSAARLRRAIAGVADGYLGVTGKLTLNAAGDRSFGSFDFWSVCTTGGSASWKRTWSYVATAPGHGKIVARDHC